MKDNFVTKALRTIEGQHRSLPQWRPQLTMRVHERDPAPSAMPFHKEYTLEIRAGATVTCAPAKFGDGAFKILRDALHHEVYGDLQELIREVRIAVYEQDTEAAMEAITKAEMYMRGEQQ